MELGRFVTVRRWLLAVLLAGSALTASRVAAQDFTLVNQTGMEIRNVFIAPHGSDSWTEDLMADEAVLNDRAVCIRFVPDANVKQWDLKTIDKDNQMQVVAGLNLLAISKVTLRMADGHAVASAE